MPTPATELLPLLPTEDDVAFYRAHGYWISGAILPDSVIAEAEAGMARLYAGSTDHALPGRDGIPGWSPADGDVLRKNDWASLQVDELASLVRHPLIAACAARLSGASEIRLWHDQLLYKPAESSQAASGRVNVGWHTDRQYWLTNSSTDMLTAWVPFHSVGEVEGVVSFVDGSHLFDDDIVLDFFNPDLSQLDSVRASHDVRIATHEIPRGGMSFHHCRTIHGSGPNLSGAPRRSIAVHLQPGDNHFVEFHRPDGTLAHHGNDDLVRRTADGHPDYTDPAICPRLF